MVTGLISFHLLKARRNISKLLPSNDMHVYTGVVAILIESALPLSVFGVIFAAFTRAALNPRGPGFIVAYYTFGCLFYSFCSLSPHMIIFRVTTGRSWLKFPRANETVNPVSNPINFAHHTTDSSSDSQSAVNGEFTNPASEKAQTSEV
ncbi:hypothetical protein H1R20_g8915, partial [Candolleomyces eurysporus]